MVSKAREDLPEPESPVTTVRVLRGIATLTLRRLCWRAPRTVMWVMPGRFGRGTAWFPLWRDGGSGIRIEDVDMLGRSRLSAKSLGYGIGGRREKTAVARLCT